MAFASADTSLDFPVPLTPRRMMKFLPSPDRKAASRDASSPSEKLKSGSYVASAARSAGSVNEATGSATEGAGGGGTAAGAPAVPSQNHSIHSSGVANWRAAGGVET